MKKILLSLSAVAAFGAIVWSANQVDAQAPGGGAPAPVSQPQPTRPRIALVNSALVMRKFDRAAAEGKNISARSQYHADLLKPINERINQLTRAYQMSQVPADKESLKLQIRQLSIQKEDMESAAKTEINAMADKAVVEVYQDIKAVIEAIAVANNLELVMCYPDGSSPEDDKKPAVAQMKLQSPGLIPFYHRNMDITETVIKTLNQRYPAPPVAVAPPAGAPTGVVPAGATAPVRKP